MLWMIVGMAFAEKKSEAVAIDPVDPDEMRITQTRRTKLAMVRTTLAPYRAKLRETLATEHWYDTRADTAPDVFADIWTVIEPHLDSREPLYIANQAVAVERRITYEMGESRYVRSHAKILGEAKDPSAMAYGLQQIHHGRGTTTTSRDVLVLFDQGRPTHVYTSSVDTWTGHLESLWTLELDGLGQIVGAIELTAGNPTVQGETDWETVAGLHRTWTRTQ